MEVLAMEFVFCRVVPMKVTLSCFAATVGMFCWETEN